MDTKAALKGYQRAALMKQAHHLEPTATVGRNGLTEAVAEHVERELERHELVKVRFSDWKDSRRDITETLSSRLGAYVVSVIGNIGVLYRPADSPEDRVIRFPVRPGDRSAVPGKETAP